MFVSAAPTFAAEPDGGGAPRTAGRPELETQAEGMAKFQQGKLRISADRLTYDYALDQARASGNVLVSRNGDIYRGQELQLSVERFEGYFLRPSYFFARTNAGGSAARVDFLSADRAVATAATYTSCPPDGSGDPAWLLTTDRVRFDFAANEGVAEGTVLRFLGVPILAAPALSFPLTDERKSGWLPPSVNLDNKSGLRVAVPYYWNIAPNRDATLTPTVSARRGPGLETEYRYLEPRYNGLVNLNLLPNDNVTGQSRYALDLAHEGALSTGWVFKASSARVSDDSYWKDFPRGVSSLTPRLLLTDLQTRRHFVSGGGDWLAYARVQRWQVLQDPELANAIDAPFERSPQIGVLVRRRLGRGFDVGIESEFNRFVLPPGVTPTVAGLLPQPEVRSGNRWHAIGSLAWPYASAGWSFTPRLSVNTAAYTFDHAESGRTTDSRTIPTLSLDSAWVLERDSSWFGRATRQTLEPRLLYVYTPYREQSLLPNFDATAKDFSFESIYTDNAFAGVDRVSDANQLTAGVTTRIFDHTTGAEVLKLGVAQRFLFADQQLTADGVPLQQRFSDVLLLGSSRLVPRWVFDGSVQYSPDIRRSVRSVVGARYSPRPFRTVNATYRLARGLSEQVEMGWQWALANQRSTGGSHKASATTPTGAGGCKGRWYSVGRFSFSTKDSRITDSLLGFEYDAGCWIGRIVTERLSTGRSEATTRLLLQLELVGLSRLGSNPLQLLKDNIPGYRLLRDTHAGPTSATSYD